MQNQILDLDCIYHEQNLYLGFLLFTVFRKNIHLLEVAKPTYLRYKIALITLKT
jgi:hypothetical protein